MACQSGDPSDTLHQHLRAEVNGTWTIYPASHPRAQPLHKNAGTKDTNPTAAYTQLESKQNYHVVLWDSFNLGL